MQSGVNPADPKPRLSVWPRLRTDTLSSDRKVRPRCCSTLHPFARPSFHPFIPFHWSSFTIPSTLPNTAAHCAPASSYLPPHPLSHVLPLSTCTVSSLFNHIFSLSVLVFASRTTPCLADSFHPSSLHQPHTSLLQTALMKVWTCLTHHILIFFVAL